MGVRITVVYDEDGLLPVIDEAARHLPGARTQVIAVVGVDGQGGIQRGGTAGSGLEEGLNEPGLAEARQADQADALAWSREAGSHGVDTRRDG